MEPLIIFKFIEVRCPKEGELIKRGGGYIEIAMGRDCNYLYPIYERIEIPVPEGATRLSYNFIDHEIFMGHGSIPLSRPKVKVKKYQWQSRISGVDIITQEYFVEPPNCIFTWRKVEGTEVEVE